MIVRHGRHIDAHSRLIKQRRIDLRAQLGVIGRSGLRIGADRRLNGRGSGQRFLPCAQQLRKTCGLVGKVDAHVLLVDLAVDGHVDQVLIIIIIDGHGAAGSGQVHFVGRIELGRIAFGNLNDHRLRRIEQVAQLHALRSHCLIAYLRDVFAHAHIQIRHRCLDDIGARQNGFQRGILLLAARAQRAYQREHQKEIYQKLFRFHCIQPRCFHDLLGEEKTSNLSYYTYSAHFLQRTARSCTKNNVLRKAYPAHFPVTLCTKEAKPFE